MIVSLYRDIKAFFQNSSFINHGNIPDGFLFIGAQPNIEVSFYNCIMGSSISSAFPLVTINAIKSVNLENVIFGDVVGTLQPIIQFSIIFDFVSIKNLTVNNVSGTSAGVSDIIVFTNFPQTITVLEQIHMFNLSLDGIAAIRSNSELDQIQIID